MQIAPRTGTLAALLSTSGALGELSSATDVNALVQHTGVAGGAKAIFGQCAAAKTVNITGAGSNVVQPTLDPNYAAYVVTKDGGVTSVANFGQLAAGTAVNQKVTIINGMGITSSLRIDGSTSLGAIPHTGIVEVRWTGAAWIRTGRWLGSSVGTVIGAGAATNVTATAIGGGTASAAGSLALGGGTASGTNSLAMGTGVATGVDSIAIRGAAEGSRSIALGGARAFLQNSIGKIVNNYNAFAKKPQEVDALLARLVEEDNELPLTFDGTNANTSNTLHAAQFAGRMHFLVRGSLFDATNGNKSVMFENVYDLSSDGTVLTINGFTAISWNVIGDFSGDGLPTVTHAVGSNQVFELRVAAPSNYAIDAAASVSVLGIY
jgi:hypothetical protein